MANYIEYDPNAYIASFTDLQAKIIAINVIINNNIALIGTVIDQTNGMGATVKMYELDDGQVRIKTNYQSVSDIIAANHGLETMKNLYIRQLNGSSVTLRDKSTFNRGWGGGYFGW